jgi:hypothetical protein
MREAEWSWEPSLYRGSAAYYAPPVAGFPIPTRWPIPWPRRCIWTVRGGQFSEHVRELALDIWRP